MFKYERATELLKAQGRTRQWLADECEVTINTIYQLLSGHRAPGKQVLKLISIALGVPKEELTSHEEKRSQI